jgi:hypothetical protein
VRRILIPLCSLALALATAGALHAQAATGFTLAPAEPAPSLALESGPVPSLTFGSSTISSFGDKPKGDK